MPSTYTPLATQTLGSATATVTFSSISNTYTDLVLVINASVTSGNPDVIFNINSDTGSNYSRTTVRGNGTTASSTQSSNATAGYLDSAASANTTAGAWNAIAHFMNYSNTNTYKTVILRENHASLGTSALVNLWRNTSAITSISLTTTNSPTTFASGSTFTLYGIASA